MNQTHLVIDVSNLAYRAMFTVGQLTYKGRDTGVLFGVLKAVENVNGEIKESTEVSGESATGSWSLPVDRSSWAALLVRGQCPDYPEIIAAHSSAVMIEVEGTPFLAAADAFTILEQLEGAMAYLDTVGTRAETEAYKRMCLVLESAHRSLHNRMHQAGQYHEHTTTQDHPEHRK